MASLESTRSQWCWPTSIWAWEFPAQGRSQAQTLDPDQGHSGKCSPLGVGRAVRDGGGDLRRGESKGVTLTLIPGWEFNILGKWLNLRLIGRLSRHQPRLRSHLPSFA